MKRRLSIVFTALGMALVPLAVVHWLFVLAAIFAFIAAILFKK